VSALDENIAVGLGDGADWREFTPSDENYDGAYGYPGPGPYADINLTRRSNLTRGIADPWRRRLRLFLVTCVRLDAKLGRLAEEPVRCSAEDNYEREHSSEGTGPLLTRGCKLSVRKHRGGSLPLSPVPLDDSEGFIHLSSDYDDDAVDFFNYNLASNGQ
jgi:hypothetical protein